MTTQLHKNALTSISIEGFKSIGSRQTLELGALNVLAGANSAGKSSFMQPLLLLKQTLEAQYDPGPLMLDGPNVHFTEYEQFFSRDGEKSLKVELRNARLQSMKVAFRLNEKKELITEDYVLTDVNTSPDVVRLVNGMDADRLREIALASGRITSSFLQAKQLTFKLFQERFFLNIAWETIDGRRSFAVLDDPIVYWLSKDILHVPGLRGNPERSYQKTGVGDHLPGMLHTYVASIVDDWQQKGDERLAKLGTQLASLGLTWKVAAKRLNAVLIELQVGRLPNSNDNQDDVVNIADVGFGVSQVLPVLVALLVAKPGQLVYIEQPEIHLHPKAQRALAGIFAAAIENEVQVVVETHSQPFLLALQTLVAQKVLDKSLVKFHWVERDNQGETRVSTANLDDAGAYGPWPQNFDSSSMEANQAYIDAASAVLFGKG